MVADLHFATARELLRRLDAGEVTSSDLVGAQLARIEAVDPQLQAMVTVDAEGARAAAEAADRERAEGRLRGRLHGLPMTVKDAFATAGMRTTAGLQDLGDHIPEHDAAAVARLRAAGAIVVGKTSCPPGVSGQETGNALVGTTRNPWDPVRTTGGSSGGAAAALAAGLTPLELGSDLGGSIRQPSAFCGVFGHYPTHGIVPSRGHLPAIPASDLEAHEDLMVVGPMARSAQDLELALDVLAGPDVISARGWRLALPPATHGGIQDLRVAVWDDDQDFPVDAAVRTRMAAVVGLLDDNGAVVRPSERPAFSLVEAERIGFDLWVAASSGSLDDAEVAEQLRRSLAAHSTRGRRTDAADRIDRRARASTMRHRDWLQLDARRRRLQRAWDELFERVDVLLCPVSPVVAYTTDPDPSSVHDFDHRAAQTITVDGKPRPYLDQLVWTTAVGFARLPSTVVPVGSSPDGLPVGIQVVGRPFADRTTLQVAAQIAELTGGFQPPPLRGHQSQVSGSGS